MESPRPARHHCNRSESFGRSIAGVRDRFVCVRRATRIAALLLAAALVANPTRADQSAWKQAFDAAWTDAQAAEAAGQWDDAVAAYERVAKLVPFECLTRYNLARMSARAGKPREALIALAEAVEYGWCDGIAIVNEPAFVPLRDDSDFARAVRRAAEIIDERQVVYVPAGVDKTKPAPLIIALHGRGETPQGFLPYWRAAADSAGAILVVPRGVTQLGGCIANAWDQAPPTSAPASAPGATSGPAWRPAGVSAPADARPPLGANSAATPPPASKPAGAAASQSATAPAADDVTTRDPANIDLPATRRAVDVCIALARQYGQVDDQKIVLAGFSQGGAAALRLLADNPQRYAGAITLGALYNTADAAAWADAAKQRPLRVAMFAGALDRLKAQSEKAVADLRAAGIEAKLDIIPAVGHEPPPDWAERQKAALRFVLKSE